MGDTINVQFYEKSHRYKINGAWAMGVTTVIGKGIDKSQPLMYWAVGETVGFLQRNIIYRDNDVPHVNIPPEIHDAYPDGAVIPFTEDNSKIIFQVARAEHERIRDMASEHGSRAHEIIMHINRGVAVPLFGEAEEVRFAVEAYIKWVKMYDFKCKAAELIVCNPNDMVAGTLDGFGTTQLPGEDAPKNTLLDIKTGNAVYDEARVQTCTYASMLTNMTWLEMHHNIQFQINGNPIQITPMFHENLAVERILIVRLDKYTAELVTPVDVPKDDWEMHNLQFHRCLGTARWLKKCYAMTKKRGDR